MAWSEERREGLARMFASQSTQMLRQFIEALESPRVSLGDVIADMPDAFRTTLIRELAFARLEMDNTEIRSAFLQIAHNVDFVTRLDAAGINVDFM